MSKVKQNATLPTPDSRDEHNESEAWVETVFVSRRSIKRIRRVAEVMVFLGGIALTGEAVMSAWGSDRANGLSVISKAEASYRRASFFSGDGRAFGGRGLGPDGDDGVDSESDGEPTKEALQDLPDPDEQGAFPDEPSTPDSSAGGQDKGPETPAKAKEGEDKGALDGQNQKQPVAPKLDRDGRSDTGVGPDTSSQDTGSPQSDTRKEKAGAVPNKTSARTPQTPVAKNAAMPASSLRKWIRHKVVSGESLTLIAKRYRVRTRDLARWNRLSARTKLRIGQSLKVFAPRDTAKSVPDRAPASSSSLGRPEKASLATPGTEQTSPNKAANRRPLGAPSSQSPAANPGSASARQNIVATPPLRGMDDHALRFPPRRDDPRLRPVASHIADFNSPRAGVASKWMIVGAPKAEKKGWWARRKERRAKRIARRKARRLARRQKGSVESETVFNRGEHRRPVARPKSTAAAASNASKRYAKQRSASVGKPNRGRLVNGVQLRNSPHYTVRTPAKAWGSPHTISLLHNALVGFRQQSRYRRELVVHDISRPRGGYFPPHKSHQSGRDVDIRLPRSARVKSNGVPQSAKDVDWDAAWALVHQLIRTDQIQYIFLNKSRQKYLYKAARRAGVSKKQLETWIQWPSRSKKRHVVVRHARGHTAHIHVRFHCAPYEQRCQTN